MMQKIYAWIRDPTNNLFKGMSKRTALFQLFCKEPSSCDLYVKENTCLNCGFNGCKFGRKTETEGPTKQSRQYYKIVSKWKEENKDYFDKLKPLKAYNRIFKTHDHFYMPYAFMTKGLGSGNPLESAWVPVEELNTDLLNKICTANPQALFGGIISDYQKKEIPKFITDLKAFYPEIFDLLPDAQKARLASVDYKGREADILTINPGKCIFNKDTWDWDGEYLIGNSMLFQPVKGNIEIRIKPNPGEAVTITDNSQVNENTKFMD